MFTTEAALVKRINRKLGHEGQKLHKSRPFLDRGTGQAHFDHNHGEYFILDVERNILLNAHVDLEAVARGLGVLAVQEEIQS
jgi:hypothetical protein